jgi:hypothetical protein
MWKITIYILAAKVSVEHTFLGFQYLKGLLDLWFESNGGNNFATAFYYVHSLQIRILNS